MDGPEPQHAEPHSPSPAAASPGTPRWSATSKAVTRRASRLGNAAARGAGTPSAAAGAGHSTLSDAHEYVKCFDAEAENGDAAGLAEPRPVQPSWAEHSPA